jgi:hypothetical protein
LRVQVAEGGRCTFAFALTGSRWQVVGDPFQARSGVWIGAKLGLVAWNPAGTGVADFDYFRFSP